MRLNYVHSIKLLTKSNNNRRKTTTKQNTTQKKQTNRTRSTVHSNTEEIWTTIRDGLTEAADKHIPHKMSQTQDQSPMG